MNPSFDPSQLDPKVLLELSTLVQQLPPAQITRMQSLMHNMMAGFDVKKEMEEFERTLPPGFREKLTGLLGPMSGPMTGPTGGAAPGATIETTATQTDSNQPAAGKNMDVRDARLTVLRAVAAGSMTPEDAEKILFSL